LWVRPPPRVPVEGRRDQLQSEALSGNEGREGETQIAGRLRAGSYEREKESGEELPVTLFETPNGEVTNARGHANAVHDGLDFESAVHERASEGGMFKLSDPSRHFAPVAV
jgi:hypothetical protein